MVMRVPEHLKGLRTDERGRPVPMINVWGSWDDPERFYLKRDPACVEPNGAPGHDIAVWYRDDPEGPPNFTRQSPQRQRRCMIARRCQVCVRPLAWGHTWLVISSISVDWIDLAGKKDVATVTEPWLCPDCRDFATRHCPGLIRRRDAHDFTTVQITSEDEVQLVVSSGWVEGPLEAATREHPVKMWAKVLVFNMDLVRATRHSRSN